MLSRRSIGACVLVLLTVTGCWPLPTTRPTAVAPFLTTAIPTSTVPPATPAVAPFPTTAVLTSTVPPTTPPVAPFPTTAVPTSKVPPATPPTLGDTRFGAVFFSTSLKDTDLPCADLQEMGIHSTFLGAWWGEIEPQPDQYDWRMVDQAVNAVLNCGIEPVLKVSVADGPGHDGTPPQDMEAYSRFMFSLAQHLKDRVRCYAIENEVGNPRMVWTAETYGLLLATAYRAIKQADPKAQVLDGLLTMRSCIIYRAHELYQAGRVQEALEMLGRFTTYIRRQEHDMPTTEQKLIKWLSGPDQQRNIALMDRLFSHPETYDALQVHYLQDAWELIPETVSWIRAWAPGKPFEFWEIGFGWEGEEAGKAFDEKSHAEGVVKTLVIALGEGASRVLYEPYWEETRTGSAPPTPEPQTRRPPKEQRKFGRGLMTPDGPRLAATAYETMTSQLSGYQNAGPVNLGSGVWAYQFATPWGDVYVAWASESITVHLALAAAQVAVTDITGDTVLADPTTLPVGTSPIFVSAP